MKIKFFMLLAAVLLSASAFAQSGNNGTLKGDVNGDGVVDVADINAIIQIMKDGGGTGEETKFYWYVGQTPPTALPTNDSQLATGLDAGWRKISNTKPIAGTVIFDGTAQDEINIATTKVTQYFAINSDVTIGSYDSQGIDQTSTFLTGPTVSNGMNIYTTTSKSKTFGHIIKVKEQTVSYYWYAGQTQPSSISGTPTVDDTNFTNNKWHTLGTATTIGKTITGGTSGQDWYVAVPTSVNLKPTAGDLSTPDTSWDNLGTITISGISYTVWRTNGTGSRSAVYMAGTGEETKYYWYVGQTQPTSMTSVTAQDSGIFTNNNWHTINVNNTYSFKNPIYNSESNPIKGDINTYWYVALPADKSYSIYDSDDVDEVNVSGNWTKLTSQITIANVTYNIYKKVSTSRQFNVYWIH